MSDFQMLYMCNVIRKHHLLKEMSVYIYRNVYSTMEKKIGNECKTSEM